MIHTLFVLCNSTTKQLITMGNAILLFKKFSILHLRSLSQFSQLKFYIIELKMKSPMNKIVLTIVTTLLIAYKVSAIKCFQCFNEVECTAPAFVECNAEEVKKTSASFSFLPKSQTQVESTSFNCAAYNAVLNNSSSVSLSGCFFNTYNPCEEIHTVPAQKWTCKYCDTRDGCNPATKMFGNLLFIWIALTFVIYRQKSDCI
ncbi:hypothetical protein Bhyg_04443 [Pseudolycoriella hygida]|uniref:Uncharacterized protein n=1 Tax=Pseudolycoriella hygida TaxID=35572 RepID=A0A9Q0S8D1_9DIPT|nr:hypothetical protein Bhyg_04443 [Pseudolycoriella hygida]